MKFLARVLPWVLLAIYVNGCALQHDIAEDYPKYLERTKNHAEFTKSNFRVEYELTQRTRSHADDIVSATVGAANTWTVQYGQMLEAQLQSRDVQAAFASLQTRGAGGADRYLVFDLNSYVFEDYRAYIQMTVTVTAAGKTLFSKKYAVEGPAQGASMWVGGAMAMRGAVQQSTKSATDNILKQLLTDLAAQR